METRQNFLKESFDLYTIDSAFWKHVWTLRQALANHFLSDVRLLTLTLQYFFIFYFYSKNLGEGSE